MFGRMMLGAVALVTSLAAGMEAQAPGGAQGHRGPGQAAGRGEMRAGGRREPMSALQALLRGIELTDAQKAKVRDISLKYRARHEAFADTLRANRDAGIRPDSTTRAKRMQIATQERTEVRTILTAEQQKTFDANIAKMQERMKTRGGRRGGQGRGGR